MTPELAAALLKPLAERVVARVQPGELNAFDGRINGSLLRLGVIEKSEWAYRLTDLGAQVRAIVLARKEADRLRPENVERIVDALPVGAAMAVHAMEPGLLVKSSSIRSSALNALFVWALVEEWDMVDGTKSVRLSDPLGVAVWRRVRLLKKTCAPADREEPEGLCPARR